jgi:hypothetical protein
LATYSDEQSYTVIRLLGDYSRVLRDLTDELDRLRLERITVVGQIVVLILSIGALFLIPGAMHSVLTTPFVIAISTVWFYTSIGSLRFLFSGFPRTKRIKSEIGTIIPKLEELARLASQIAEHAEQDRGRLLELNFQIDFAVMILDRAKRLS